MDSSDDEWKEHITRQYGEDRGGMLQYGAVEVDNGLDIAKLVEHAFHKYDVVITTEALNHGVPSYMPRTEDHEQDLAVNTRVDIQNVHDNEQHNGNLENLDDREIDVDRMDDRPGHGVEEDDAKLFQDVEGDEFFGDVLDIPEVRRPIPFLSEQVIL